MSDDEPKKSPLAVPAIERTHFARNFISQAVCEFRFPTLFELDSERPPSDLAQAFRKELPVHEHRTNLKVRPGEEVGQSHVHVFKARKNRWSVALRAAAISVETLHYDSFEDFEKRIAFVLKAAAKTIDSDFFTRVGLRYINAIPCTCTEAFQWIRPELVAPLASGVFGEPEEFSQRIVGSTDVGGFGFSHGLAKDEKTGKSQYLLDFDFFAEDVPAEDAVPLVRKLHDAEHDLFRWSLGEAAKRFLGLQG